VLGSDAAVEQQLMGLEFKATLRWRALPGQPLHWQRNG
jgi:hypothetical protein